MNLGSDRYYFKRRVLVTGGASFIGSHLTEQLVSMGARVRVCDDLSSGHLRNLSHVHQDIDFICGDLRDPNVASSVCRGQEVVFHLAASHGGRGYIETHPVDSVNNLALDHTLFSAAARAGAEKLIFASSACVYPINFQSETQPLPLREDMAGFDRPGQAFADGEYGWAKLIGELQLRAFHKQYGVSTIACRIFTAYGERENESHAIIALIAKALKRLDPYPIWGSGLQTRNFTYVRDVVTGLLLAGSRLHGFETINIGAAETYSINTLMNMIFEEMNWRPQSISRELDKPVGVTHRTSDNKKCLELLGWQPNVSLEVGLKRTLEWYSQHANLRLLDQLDSLQVSRSLELQ